MPIFKREPKKSLLKTLKSLATWGTLGAIIRALQLWSLVLAFLVNPSLENAQVEYHQEVMAVEFLVPSDQQVVTGCRRIVVNETGGK